MNRRRIIVGWLALWVAFVLVFAWALQGKRSAGAESVLLDLSQTWNGGKASSFLAAPAPSVSWALVFSDEGGRMVVTISRDGRVTFGPGAPPEESARAAWRIFAAAWPVVQTEVGKERCFRLLFGPGSGGVGP